MNMKYNQQVWTRKSTLTMQLSTCQTGNDYPSTHLRKLARLQNMQNTHKCRTCRTCRACRACRTHTNAEAPRLQHTRTYTRTCKDLKVAVHTNTHTHTHSSTHTYTQKLVKALRPEHKNTYTPTHIHTCSGFKAAA